ncbi:MAG: GDSL-type esterase/lipase family protein [Bacteroidetes bacterium]|nr:GDSL-type esterase/lipase family protein [Bacteroidota bacterium]
MQHKELIFVRGLLIASLVCSTVLAFGLTASKTKWAILFLGLILVTPTLWFFATYLHRKQKPVEWLLSIAVLNLFVVVPELALRAVDFRYESGIQWGWPRPSHFLFYEPDGKLFWKLKSSNPNVNSLGFPGKEIIFPKSNNVFRIMFLGDSVTQQGYPELVEHFLNTKSPGNPKKFECIKFAIAGYSSHQGRVLAEMYGIKHKPDLVFVYYGWNDHWQAYGATDSGKRIKTSGNVWSKINSFAYHNIRLLQGLTALRGAFGGQNAPTDEVRVPEEQYRENLRRIQKIFEIENIPVVFITAPTSHYRLGVPDYLVDMGFVPDKQSAVKRHKEYNQIVKQVAKAGGSFLLDLETEFSSTSDESLRAIFVNDGIHLTGIGVGIVAKRIVDFFETDLKFLSDRF